MSGKREVTEAKAVERLAVLEIQPLVDEHSDAKDLKEADGQHPHAVSNTA